MKEKAKENSLFNKMKWALYSLKIKIFKRKNNGKEKFSVKTKESIFLVSILVFPILQFLVFYLALNFNSLILSFQKYENGVLGGFAGLTNFANVWNDIFVTGKLALSIKNSLIMFVLSLFVMTPINILASYVVFKKCPLHNFMKVMLFMPNMISSMVFVLSYRYIVGGTGGVAAMLGIKNVFNANYSEGFYSVLIFGLWMQFAGGFIVYLSSMSSISKEVLEYGQLEPLPSYKELLFVVIPSIYPTIVTYVVVGITGFFTNAGFFHAFYGSNHTASAEISNLGFYFFIQAIGDGQNGPDFSVYPYAAAGGILFTLFVAPVTLFVKYLMEKYGPSED